DVLLVGRVVLVLQKDSDHTGRSGSHEHLLDLGARDRGTEVRDVGAYRLEVAIGDRADAGWHRKVEAAHHALHVLGELGKVSRHSGQTALAPKTIEPLLDIGRIADLARFAVIDDAHAGLRLAAHYIHHRVADLLLERRAVRLAAVTPLERLNERGRARQTPGVGRQNMLG